MTVARFVTIICDQCHAVVRSSSEQVSAAREDATRAGWAREGSRDLCPKCKHARTHA